MDDLERRNAILAVIKDQSLPQVQPIKVNAPPRHQDLLPTHRNVSRHTAQPVNSNDTKIEMNAIHVPATRSPQPVHHHVRIVQLVKGPIRLMRLVHPHPPVIWVAEVAEEDMADGRCKPKWQ